MARYASETNGSQNAAIELALDLANQVGQRNLLARTAGTITLSATELVNGVVVQTGSPGAFNATTPTATAIVAALKNAQIGSAFDFMFANGGDATVTLVAGSGVTLAGVTTVATTKARVYRGIVTAVLTPAVTLVGGPTG